MSLLAVCSEASKRTRPQNNRVHLWKLFGGSMVVFTSQLPAITNAHQHSLRDYNPRISGADSPRASVNINRGMTIPSKLLFPAAINRIGRVLAVLIYRFELECEIQEELHLLTYLRQIIVSIQEFAWPYKFSRISITCLRR